MFLSFIKFHPTFVFNTAQIRHLLYTGAWEQGRQISSVGIEYKFQKLSGAVWAEKGQAGILPLLSQPHPPHCTHPTSFTSVGSFLWEKAGKKQGGLAYK